MIPRSRPANVATYRIPVPIYSRTLGRSAFPRVIHSAISRMDMLKTSTRYAIVFLRFISLQFSPEVSEDLAKLIASPV